MVRSTGDSGLAGDEGVTASLAAGIGAAHWRQNRTIALLGCPFGHRVVSREAVDSMLGASVLRMGLPQSPQNVAEMTFECPTGQNARSVSGASVEADGGTSGLMGVIGLPVRIGASSVNGGMGTDSEAGGVPRATGAGCGAGAEVFFSQGSVAGSGGVPAEG